MNSIRLCRVVVVTIPLFVLAGGRASFAADAPTAAQALALKPIQSLVEYTIPSKEDARQCTIRPENESNVSAWVVRNAGGETLRRFSDTNNDKVVDLWCYYLDGLEVYRDIDSNFNGKADQYRWFHTAGIRWGIDKNEDGRIDSWRAISPHEVAEQVVLALKSRDQARFNLLLLTPAELNELGLGKPRTEQLAATVKSTGERFAKLAADQKLVSADSRYVDFGSARPATVPTGTAGSTKDVTVCDNASALVQSGDKHDQVFLGALIAVGDTWKLVDLPVVGANQPQPAGFFVAANAAPVAGNAVAGGPTEEMQKLMAELETLDRQAEGLTPDKQAANIEQRADRLQRLVEVTPDAEQRNFWIQQLADILSVAIQTNVYPEAGERLPVVSAHFVEGDLATLEPVPRVVRVLAVRAHHRLHQQVDVLVGEALGEVLRPAVAHQHSAEVEDDRVERAPAVPGRRRSVVSCLLVGGHDGSLTPASHRRPDGGRPGHPSHRR